MPPVKNPANEKYVKLGVTALAVALIVLTCSFLYSHADVIGQFLGRVGSLLMPFVYGAVIAYILSPVCNWLEGLITKHIPPLRRAAGGLSILGALLIALAVIVALFALLIPNLVQSIMQIVAALPDQMQTASKWLYELLESQPELQAQWDEFSEDATATISSWLETDLLTTVQVVAANLGSHITNIASVLYNTFLGILVSVYMLGNRKKFAVQAHMLLGGIFPRRWADLIEKEVRYADRMFNGFLVGRIIDSCIVGLICFAFCAIAGFDSAVLVSVVVGVTNIIPVFGPFLGAVPSAFILLMENPLHCLIFLIFILVLQQIDGNVIGPRILGETTGVSSFWVLFSVLFFGGLWGLPGMIVGVPLFAVLYDIVRQLAYRGLRRHGRDDLIAKNNASHATKDAIIPHIEEAPAEPAATGAEAAQAHPAAQVDGSDADGARDEVAG